MAVFVIIGSIGLFILLVTVILDDFLDGVFDSFDGLGGIISGPALSAFLAAFGFGAALAMGTGIGVAGATAIGAGAGLSLGALSGFVVKSLTRMPTDATLNAASKIGAQGIVVTTIPKNAVGEVNITVGGQVLKLSARSTQRLTQGTRIVVEDVISSSQVTVKALEENEQEQV